MDFRNEKAKKLKQGAIRAMFDRAATMTDVISMGIGEPDMPTPELVCRAGAEALQQGLTHYTPNAGTMQLRRAIAELPGMKARTVVVNSFSKSYAMTGWRIGYAAGPADIIDRMVKCQENFNACANAPGQYAAAIALEHPELSEQLCTVFAGRRKLLLDGLAGIDGIVCSQPEGAFYAFPDISAFGLTSQEFCEQLLERQKVVCIPGSAFGACGEGHIRVAYTCEEGMLQAAVERLHQFCREVRGA